MSPTEERLQLLLDKWVASLEAHARYATLTDEAYWKVQAWSPHERPNRWIIELALTRARELQTELVARREARDEGFAGAMELMSFLANLVGSEHIARFIPLADPANERKDPPPLPPAVISLLDPPPAANDPPAVEPTREMRRPAPAHDEAPTREMPRPAPPGDGAETREMRRATPARDTAPTRQMPRAATPAPRTDGPPPAAAPGVTAAPPAASAGAPVIAAPVSAVPADVVPPAAAGMPREVAPDAPAQDAPVTDELVGIVIADAIRLRKWGREWHELAATIARMAGRPDLTEIRRILRTHKADIEAGTPRRPPPRAP